MNDPIRITKIMVHAAFQCDCGATYERVTTAPYVDGVIGEPNAIPDGGRCNACERAVRDREERDRHAHAKKRAAQRAFANGDGIKLAD